MKYDVITIGDASEDVFIRPSELKISDSRSVVSGKVMSFELGEKIPVEEVEDEVGGSAANVAVGLSRMGLKTAIITALGEDDAGEKILKCLKTEDVDTGNVDVKAGNKTNFGLIINTLDGERTIFVYRGIKYENLKIKKSLDPHWVFVTPLGEKSEKILGDVLHTAAEKGAMLAWNPGSKQIHEGATHHRVLLKNTTVLFLNREEAIKFSNLPVRPREEDVMKRLHQLGPKIVIVTNGKEGARAYDGQLFYHIDIIESKKIDATGAGDSFATGFLGKLISSAAIPAPSVILAKAGILSATRSPGHGVACPRMTIHFDKELICDALKYGIVNSTSVVGQIGAQPGLLSVEDIEKVISTYPRLQVEVY